MSREERERFALIRARRGPSVGSTTDRVSVISHGRRAQGLPEFPEPGTPRGTPNMSGFGGVVGLDAAQERADIRRATSGEFVPGDELAFSKAFAKARAKNVDVFNWRGRTYTTKKAEESPQSSSRVEPPPSESPGTQDLTSGVPNDARGVVDVSRDNPRGTSSGSRLVEATKSALAQLGLGDIDV